MDAALAKAVVNGDMAHLRAALRDETASVSATDEEGNTLLMLALTGCEGACLGVVAALLEAGLDINTRNKKGNTALAAALGEEVSAEFVRFLLQRGADPNIADNEGWSPLMVAVVQPEWDLDTLRALLKAGASVEHVAASGETALSLAEDMDEQEMVRLLKRYRSKSR